jgi:Ca-activated chloride channel homolog
MTFLWPVTLWGLFLIPVLIAVYFLFLRRRKKFAAKYTGIGLVKDSGNKKPGFRRHVPPILFLLAITIMVVALARPAAVMKLPSQQGTIILTMDVSGSMRAEDIKPTRMDAIKNAATQFVNKQPSNVRIGVVSFSDVPAVVQEPTTDREAILAAINRLTPQRGTAIGRGITTSLMAIFENPDAPATATNQLPNQDKLNPVQTGSHTSAFIVLMSDGENNVGPDPIAVSDNASALGVRIYTVGVGSPEGTALKLEGFSVKVILDEKTLRTIADNTGGLYYGAANYEDLAQVYTNLSTQLVFETKKTDITFVFTAAAAIVLIVAAILSLMWFSRLL